jgi:uncharacterized protein YbjT (DUF2867 family)
MRKPQPREVLVTGATGHVGRHVVDGLLAAGVGVRAVTRDPSWTALPDAAGIVQADLSVPGSLEPHLDGVDAAFLAWPFTTAEGAAEVVAALARHVRRIVYLSSMGGHQREPAGAVAFHAEVEHLIEASGAAWTFLRPSGFATNALLWAPQIQAGDVVRWPFASAARSLIDERDIAQVAVRALTSDGHASRRLHLTGPGTLTQDAQVRAIGDALGRPLRFEEIPPQDAREELLAAWGDPAFVDGALTAWARFVAEPEPITSTVELVTGTRARRFRDWAVDHADEFAA